MVGSTPWPPPPGSDAQWAADKLALALEDVGFDVGRAFPGLGSGADRAGVPMVDIGQVAVPVADGLAAVLSQAARHGVTTPGSGGGAS